MSRIHRTFSLAFALMLCIGSLAVQSAHAQTDATLTIAAEIGWEPVISITLCDPTVSFGTGLSPNGTAPIGDDAGVQVRDGISPGQGAYYDWSPLCGGNNISDLKISSNVPIDFQFCGTENAAADNAPTVQLADQDLQLSLGSTPPTSFGGWESLGQSVPVCGTGLFSGFFGGPFQNLGVNVTIALRIEEGDASGGFLTQVTIALVPS